MSTDALRYCPHCDHKTAPKLLSAPEINKKDLEPGHYAVCCRIDAGGCGATGTYDQNPEVAIAKWNRRPTRQPPGQSFMETMLARVGGLVLLLPIILTLFMFGYATGFTYAALAHGFKDAMRKWAR